MADEMKTLFPGKEITIKGELINVLPFKFGQFKEVSKHLGAIGQSAGNLRGEMFPNILYLVEHHADSVGALITLATKKPIEWVNDLDPDEVFEVVGAVIEVNGDFFINKALPKMRQAFDQIKQTTKS